MVTYADLTAGTFVPIGSYVVMPSGSAG